MIHTIQLSSYRYEIRRYIIILFADFEKAGWLVPRGFIDMGCAYVTYVCAACFVRITVIIRS